MNDESVWPETAVWWMAAAALAGIAVGQWLGATARQTVFFAVLAAGAYCLAALWQVGVTVKEKIPSVRRVADTVVDRDGGDVLSALLETDEALSHDEARAWLDQFLRKQQS